MRWRLTAVLSLPGLVVLVGVLALCCVGCSMSWNTLERGAVRNYVVPGPMSVISESEDLGMPEEPFPTATEAVDNGLPTVWMDVKITQGSEAQSEADTKASVSAAVTGQGEATGGTATTESDETETTTDTTNTGNEGGDGDGG